MLEKWAGPTIKISVDGELILGATDLPPSKVNDRMVLMDLHDGMKELELITPDHDLDQIETLAHAIKNQCITLGNEELKTTFFRIELAARRRNISQVMEYIIQAKVEFARYYQ